MLALAVQALLCAPHPSAAAEKRRFDIPAQPLGQALLALAIDADISISLTGVDLTNQTSRMLFGYDDIPAALQRMLTGTGLGFEQIEPAAYRIVQLPAAPPAPAPVAKPVDVPIRLPPIDEITVTALKRPVSLQALPLSLAVVAGSNVSDYRLRSFGEASSLVAGVNASNQGVGRNKLFVRGISDGAFVGNTQSAVGLYIDETRAVFNAPDPDLQLFDIQRIEVIRGPQGTLYGAGAISGLVRIISMPPALGKYEAAGSIDGSIAAGTGPSGVVEAMVNVPVIADTLAVRGVGYVRRDGGYIRNSFLGDNKVNRTDTSGFRGGGRLALSQDWTVRAGVIWQSTKAADTQYYDGAMARFSRGNLIAEPSSNRFFDSSLTVDGDLEWADLVSSTSWVSQDVDARYDASLALPALTRLPVRATGYDQTSRYRTLNHETRLVSPPGTSIEWLAGVFLSRRHEASDATLTLVDLDPDEIVYNRQRHDKGSEIALFGQATVDVGSHIFLTAGLRAYRGALFTTADTSELVDVDPIEAVGENIRSGVTPKASVMYQPMPEQLFYADVAQGFRLGGTSIESRILSPTVPARRRNGPALTVSNFASDKLWNLEVGSKSAFFEKRLLVNASAYYAFWSNMQIDLTHLNGLQYTENLGHVHNVGFEIESSFAPDPRFQIIANLSWSNPELVLSSTAPVTANRLPVLPKLAATLAAQYEVPVAADYTGYFNVKADIVGQGRLRGNTRVVSVVHDYQLVGMRAGVRHSDVKISVYVENVLNRESNTYAFGNPFSFGRIAQVTPLRPRTVGINLDWTR